MSKCLTWIVHKCSSILVCTNTQSLNESVIKQHVLSLAVCISNSQVHFCSSSSVRLPVLERLAGPVSSLVRVAVPVTGIDGRGVERRTWLLGTCRVPCSGGCTPAQGKDSYNYGTKRVQTTERQSPTIIKNIKNYIN